MRRRRGRRPVRRFRGILIDGSAGRAILPLRIAGRFAASPCIRDDRRQDSSAATKMASEVRALDIASSRRADVAERKRRIGHDHLIHVRCVRNDPNAQRVQVVEVSGPVTVVGLPRRIAIKGFCPSSPVRTMCVAACTWGREARSSRSEYSRKAAAFRRPAPTSFACVPSRRRDSSQNYV